MTLPISIILGPSISLVNTVLLSLIFFPEYYKNTEIKLYDKNALIALIVLYVYLIFNSLISIDLFSGILRNAGFFQIYFIF